MVVRGIHPLDARRYELERLKCFSLELVGVRDGTFVIKATARDNHRDERLFGFGEVRQLVATESSDGQVQALPELEKKYFAVLGLFRLFQLNRPSRSRLYWNRITINVEPPTSLSPQSVRPVVERLDESSKGLGIEKVVIRLRHKASDTKQEQPLALSFANRSGTGMKVRIGAPSTRPIRTLCPREQRIIKARRLDLIHPSEVLATLVNQSDEEHTGFPRGDFQEYELSHDDNGLRPVHRDFGDNEANVVVGLIRNFTEKHPAGMLRVVIFGDPSREMGALAEPECRRIIAAIDLAERLKVPVEWFAVSSGARIAMDVGTEGLDWVARVLRRIVTFTEQDGEVNVIVTGVNVGGQSYWNAEATMLMHTRGILVMTEKAAMVLTGKRALDYSGGVSASSNQGIGGADRIMGPNGQAQYVVRDVAEACRVLFQHYDHTYVASGEESPRRFETRDPVTRDIRDYPLAFTNESGLQTVGDIFSAAKNPDRKKPFDMRSLMGAVIDQDSRPLERFARMRNADSAIVWDAHFGGYPATLIGIESRPLPRLGLVPGDGPTSWTGGTLFPVSSKKVARAIHAASGNRPLVVLANLSGFDGSPESMRELQLEYGAEIGKAIVDFRGPIVFCVVSRYHGGAYVVFSHALSENLEVLAVEGSCASVIGGAPAAAVVFTAEVRARTAADPRVVAARRAVDTRDSSKRLELVTIAEETSRVVFAEKQAEVAREFDAVHSVARAVEVGSVHRLIAVANLREELITAIERGIAKARLVPVNKASREWKETRLMTVRNLTSSEEVL
jgi:acetyl-CoA carboxylase carboxyltransferase component